MALKTFHSRCKKIIFTFLPNTQSVQCLIQASPRLYQVFLASKKTIISSICQQHGGLPGHLRVLGPLTLTPVRDQLLRFDLLPHLIEVYGHDQETLRSAAGGPPSNAEDPHRITSTVDYFLDDFAEQVGCLQAEYGNCGRAQKFLQSLAAVNNVTALTETEKRRLRRAFHRFQLFQEVFWMLADVEALSFISLQIKAFETIYSHCQPHELEEVACVEAYLIARMEQAYCRVEDQLATNIVAWARPKAKRDPEFAKTATGRFKLNLFGSQFRMFSKSKKASQILFIHGQLHLGLEYLHKSSTLDGLSN